MIELPKENEDGIYGVVQSYGEQVVERNLRESIANKEYENYLLEISKHHSIPVMDNEIKRFLKNIPYGGVILDLGGCWGWHWRDLPSVRPDVKVVVMDLIRGNLVHAKKVLEKGLGGNFFLVHGNALNMDLLDGVFDGVWSVQTTQHIANYDGVLKEVWRVLKVGGLFADYCLNNALVTRLIYKYLNKNYHIVGNVTDNFYLKRADVGQGHLIQEVFNSPVNTRFTEIIFSPELKLPLGGGENSLIGRLDSLVCGSTRILSLIARQRSFHTFKS